MAYTISILCWMSACNLPGEEAIDSAIELGKLPSDRYTSLYLRVYEDNENRFYLNGHLIDFKELEKRAEKIGPGNGLIYYANQTSSEKIPKESKIVNLLKEKQIGFVTYQDSAFTKRYY